MTLLSPRVTSFQGRNSLDARHGRGLERWSARAHPSREILDALGRVMALRDPATAQHSMRVQVLAVALAEEVCLGDDLLVSAIRTAAPLHDIGKLAIPDRLLDKPGPLTHDEYELVKRHAAIGADVLDGLQFGAPLARIVRHHHENWEGTGYPDALAGEAIPVGARVLAVVDCYDALTSDRPYREPLSHASALAMIVARRGTMYDPAILDAFLRVMKRQQSGDGIPALDFSRSPYRLQPVRVI